MYDNRLSQPQSEKMTLSSKESWTIVRRCCANAFCGASSDFSACISDGERFAATSESQMGEIESPRGQKTPLYDNTTSRELLGKYAK
jgi:hypothetical protein